MSEPLLPMERRVLGVLVEKAMTAATSEPLTLNAVVVGSNQKSNRDPLVNYEEPEVDESLTRLARKGLVFRQTGGRTDRWRHNLYDAWKLGKPEVALLAELLLRGPQTAAEARTRASRMASIDSEQLPEMIKSLVEKGMIVWITPEGRRGAILTHGFHTPNELQSIRHRNPVSDLPPEPESAPPLTVFIPPPVAAFKPDPRVDEALSQIAELRETVARLQKQLADLHANLGVPLPGNP